MIYYKNLRDIEKYHINDKMWDISFFINNKDEFKRIKRKLLQNKNILYDDIKLYFRYNDFLFYATCNIRNNKFSIYHDIFVTSDFNIYDNVFINMNEVQATDSKYIDYIRSYVDYSHSSYSSKIDKLIGKTKTFQDILCSDGLSNTYRYKKIKHALSYTLKGFKK